MRHMFRLIVIPALLICLGSLTAASAAATPNATSHASEEIRYRFEDTSGSAHNEVTIFIPKDFTVITRDTPPDDPGLVLFKTDSKSMTDYLVKHNYFIYALSVQPKSEIIMKMSFESDSGAIENLNTYSDNQLNKFREIAVEALKGPGKTVLSSDIYSSANQKYIQCYLSHLVDGEPFYTYVYTTFINKYGITFYLNSHNQDLSGSQKEIIEHIVDTAIYYPEPVSAAAAKIRSDGDSVLASFLKYAIIGIVLAASVSIGAAVKKKKSAKASIYAIEVHEAAPPAQILTPSTMGYPSIAIDCPTCGMTNEADRIVCYRCGRTLNPEAPAENPNKTAETSDTHDSETV